LYDESMCREIFQAHVIGLKPQWLLYVPLIWTLDALPFGAHISLVVTKKKKDNVRKTQH